MVLSVMIPWPLWIAKDTRPEVASAFLGNVRAMGYGVVVSGAACRASKVRNSLRHGHNHASGFVCVSSCSSDETRVDHHLGKVFGAWMNAFGRKRCAEERDERTCDVVAKGSAHCLCADVGHPVTC